MANTKKKRKQPSKWQQDVQITGGGEVAEVGGEVAIPGI